uniref:U6-Eretoxin-Ek1v_1 n=1 Tax=Eresus cinnaberinus TaxID=175337 RepID=A0A2D0PBP0_ERECI
MILLVVCIAVAASENYCPEVKGECSLSYRINDCCSQNDCPSYAMCCKGRCGYVCKNPSTSRQMEWLLNLETNARLAVCTPKLDWSGYLDQNLNEMLDQKYHRIRKSLS